MEAAAVCNAAGRRAGRRIRSSRGDGVAGESPSLGLGCSHILEQRAGSGAARSRAPSGMTKSRRDRGIPWFQPFSLRHPGEPARVDGTVTTAAGRVRPARPARTPPRRALLRLLLRACYGPVMALLRRHQFPVLLRGCGGRSRRSGRGRRRRDRRPTRLQRLANPARFAAGSALRPGRRGPAAMRGPALRETRLSLFSPCISPRR